MTWIKNNERHKILARLRSECDQRPYPFTYAEVREIGSTIGLKHKVDLWRLRLSLREAALIAWETDKNEGSVGKAERRDSIRREVIEPVDQLLRSFQLICNNGAGRAFDAVQSTDRRFDFDRFYSDLTYVKLWAESACKASMDGTVPKGETIVKEELVLYLLMTYLFWTGEIPTRRVSKDHNKYYDDGSFPIFVRLVAKVVFGKELNLTRQIQDAIATHSTWMEDAQNIPLRE